MAVVPVGSRLVLRTPTGPIVLRTVAAGWIGDPGGWTLPVLAPVEALLAGWGTVEAPTAEGLLEAVAHLAVQDGVLVLASGRSQELLLRQRRDDVRWPAALPFRAAALDATGEDLLGQAQSEGVTTSVSGGGLHAQLNAGPRPVTGARVFVELELPGPSVVPVVIEVVQASEAGLRGRFLDIAPIDRERIVRLVFAEQRRELSRRRRDGEALTAARD